MSTLSAWSYTNIATIWPQSGTDEWGQPIYGTPYTIACTWSDTGDTQTSADGTEFVPASTFWFEMPYGGAAYEAYATSEGAYETLDGGTYQVATTGISADGMPQRDDFIAKFDQTAITDPRQADAQKIKKITSHDMSPFGAAEIPDWEIYT